MARNPKTSEPVTYLEVGEQLTALAAQPDDVDLDALVQSHGLVYIDHVQREQRQGNGPPRKVWLTTERLMSGADVLNHRFDGGDVLIVTADGQKWRFRADGTAQNLMEG